MKKQTTYNIFLALLFFTISCRSMEVPLATETALSAVEPSPINNTPNVYPPEIPSAVFDTNNVNNIPPDNILKEVGYFGTGGGLDCELSYSEPTIEVDPFDTTLLIENRLVTCGWIPNQEIHGSVTYPDGQVYSITFFADDWGAGVLSFRPMLSDPEGLYIFNVSAGGRTLESNADYRRPTMIGVYELNDKQILLNNFPPGEIIKLFMYRCIDNGYGTWCLGWDIVGWQEYKVDEYGQLLINAPVKNGYFVILTSDGYEIPAYSLEVKKHNINSLYQDINLTLEKYNEFYQKHGQEKSCPPTAPTQIEITGYDESITILSPIYLYANPRVNARPIMKLDEGAIIPISGDYSPKDKKNLPICQDGKIWWRVRALDSNNVSQSGYVVEYENNGIYYVSQNK